MIPGLVAIDLDGTLLTPAHDLSPASVTALGAAREAGVGVVIASSRGPSSIRPFIDRLGLKGEFIAAQGALTGRFDAGGALHVSHETTIPLTLAHAVVAAASRLGGSVSWIAGMDWLVSRVDPLIEHQTTVLRERPALSDLCAETRPPHKILVIVPGDRVDSVEPLIKLLPSGVKATLSHPTFLEITCAGVDKGEALRRLCARLGVPAARVAAIGDGRNDVEMLRFAGIPIAMGNAVAELRAGASIVTGTNAEDGVAHAIRTLLEAKPG